MSNNQGKESDQGKELKSWRHWRDIKIFDLKMGNII